MQSVEASIRSLWPLDSWIHSTAVVGVSGGPDSVALLHALGALSSNKASLVVVHIDHGLRGTESDGDREFVENLAASRNLPCEAVRLSEHRTAALNTSEEALRKARHRHLRRIAMEHRAAWIVTAHHADDVVETMLHRLLRGSGPRGLASIAPVRTVAPNVRLVHPLLKANRAGIMEYVAANALEYRTDRSNTSQAYTRNRIRHQLLPYLREFAGTPHLDQRLWQAAQQIRDEHALVEAAARTWMAAAHVGEHGIEVEFPANAFSGVEWCVVREGLVQIWHELAWPLQGMTARHWIRLRTFLQTEEPGTHPRRMQLPGPIDVTMRRHRIRFNRKEMRSE
jgi:tRNA(Ile)-lysidine synthase